MPKTPRLGHCERPATQASLDRVMQELIELRAVCSSGVVPEEILTYDFGAMRMDMD